jgi:hypothetical protein
MASLWKTLEPSLRLQARQGDNQGRLPGICGHAEAAGKSNSTVKTELEALRACLRWHYGKEAPVIVAPPRRSLGSAI